MCFSAPVSFAASAALTVIGIGALRKVKSREEASLAVIPMLFAIQQGIEGLLWLILPHAEYGMEQYRLTQAYAVFVGIIWPTLIPFSLLVIEPDKRRKALIGGIFLLGAAIAFYTWSIISRFGVSAMIAEQCIVYQYPGDDMQGTLTAYFIATCFGFFFSSHRGLRWIGVVNVIGFLVAYYFYRFSYASVWCFFAAGISGLIYLHFQRVRTREAAQQARCTV